MALLITLVILAILMGATLALASLATGDLEIAAGDRMSAVAFSISESGIDEVLSDGRIAEAPPSGYAPDPGAATLIYPYTPDTSASDADYSANVMYVRDGPVEESSAIQVRSIVYNVAVTGRYKTPGTNESAAQTIVNAEFYRIAPNNLGTVTKNKHYQ